MSAFVKSLQRLYPERITAKKVYSLLAEGKITQEEYDFIIG